MISKLYLFNTMYNKTISLYVCMAIKHMIVLFVETPRKFITAVINLRDVSKKQNYYIIKQLLNSVFAICKIIKVSVSVISLAFGSADNAYLGP